MIVRAKWVDFWENFKLEEDMIYNSLLRIGYEVQIDDNPEIIVYSCFGQEHLKYRCIRIFYTGENVCPDFNICDYALGFEEIDFGDRYLRAPLYFHPAYKKDYELMASKHLSGKTDKEEFCSFTVSNKNADPIRISFFKLLSEYKLVSSGGQVENNLSDGKPVEDKLAFDSKHKFSMAFENVSHPGYTTEKIVQAYAAGTIPIYWGDPDIEKDFNSASFVNIMKYTTLSSAIEWIKEIDNNDKLYLSMIRQPAKRENQISRDEFEGKLDLFLENILKQDPTKRERASRSFWNAIHTGKLERQDKLWDQYVASSRWQKMIMKLMGVHVDVNLTTTINKGY